MTEKSGQLKDAIEVLKRHKDRDDLGSMVYESIDTVVAHCEKPLLTDEQIETWNAAIDAAAENAEAYRGLVDKQSILKLKK